MGQQSSKNFDFNARFFGGISIGYSSLTEVDFTAIAGVAYSPPESGNFRRINVSRCLQLLSDASGEIETFQTSAAEIRLPANTLADATNDAGDGRLIIFKNSGTGTINIKDYVGNLLWSISQDGVVIATSNDNNNWDFYYTAKQIDFNNLTNGFIATNVQDAIEEGTQIGGTASRGPTVCGFDGTGSSGRYLEFYQNAPSSSCPFIVAEDALLIAVSIVTSSASATGRARIYRNGVGIQDITLTAQKKNRIKGLALPLTDLDEISVSIVSGSITRPVVYMFIRTLL